jgi:hypothetical protein
VTREERPQRELLRIAALDDGSVVIDRSGRVPGRGAWITPTRPVFEQLLKKPKVLLRALEIEAASGIPALLDDARAATAAGVLDLLSLAARSGRLASGADQVKAAVRGEAILGLVTAADASEQSVAAARGDREIAVWPVPWTKEELGRRVGKGPRAVLALRRGGPAEALARQLRRMADLR